MSLISTITTRVKATQGGSNDLGSPTFPLNNLNTMNLADGTGASQADLLFSDTRTLTASSTEDLDLAGSLTDVFGSVLIYVKVKAIVIKAASGNTNNVEVKPATTNGFLGPFNAASDTLEIPPGGAISLFAPINGWAVTAGTGDLITITNSAAGTSVSYDIIIIGTSA